MPEAKIDKRLDGVFGGHLEEPRPIEMGQIVIGEARGNERRSAGLIKPDAAQQQADGAFNTSLSG